MSLRLENNRQTVIGFNHYLYSSGGKGVSHQKAHRDCVAVEPRRYDNADPIKQKKFVKLLKKNAHQKAWGENSIL